ncbi:hypothetical protein [Flavobacterium caeni]|uniref:SprB repeat-containing protein n=1 Tax=Flavobacterium caeni TaxID=490189 RepID=A0A1G5H1V3_9FLAO|nr:hypothetical protein [Flavobacterium caeni]SCY57724.1 hypothetical protein SAMN02927903_01727 [Flavobacterium caeni]
MRNHIKAVLFICIFIVSMVSCSDKDEKPIVTTKPSSDFTIYKNQTGSPNADALQARFKNEQLEINIYGLFDSDNNPTQIKTVTYQKANNDTLVNLIIDPAINRISSAFYSVNGVNSPVVLKFDYVEGSPNTFDVSYNEYNWDNHTAEVFYAVRVENNAGTANDTFNPFFADRGGIPTFAESVQAVGIGIAVVEGVNLGIAGIGALTQAGAALLAAASASGLIVPLAVGTILYVLVPELAGASELPPSDLNYPPNVPPHNPVQPANDPTSNLQTSNCNTANISFVASMDQYGSIAITQVNGGQAPYTYMVGSGFQGGQIFSNNYQNGSYLVGVKDANGCVSVKIVALTREIDCDDSTLQVTTSATSNSATANATGGTAPYIYLWSNNSTNATATGLTPGIYNVTVTDAEGCEKSGSALVTDTGLVGTWTRPNGTAGYCSGANLNDVYVFATDNTFTRQKSFVAIPSWGGDPYCSPSLTTGTYIENGAFFNFTSGASYNGYISGYQQTFTDEIISVTGTTLTIHSTAGNGEVYIRVYTRQ